MTEDPKLSEKFKLKKEQDKEFAQNPEAQLTFIYYNSPHYEKAHKRYPIFRLEQG